MGNSEELKPVKELTIEEVLFTTDFFGNVHYELTDIWNRRQKARKELGELKPHPIDKLNKNGYLEPAQFVLTYMAVLNKTETKLSSRERQVVLTLGNTAFNKTMKKLIADEEKRNNDNGKD